MALLCYNKGCGQRFDPEHNAEGEWAPVHQRKGECVLLSQSVALAAVPQPSCQAQRRQPIWQELALELLAVAGGSWAGLLLLKSFAWFSLFRFLPVSPRCPHIPRCPEGEWGRSWGCSCRE